MMALYLAFLIFGSAFTVPMVLAGLDFDGDVDAGGFDADTDVGDIDVGDVDTADAGHGGAHGGGGAGDFGAVFASLFSFRSLVFGATFFGLTGFVLSLLGTAPATTLTLAVMLGFMAALLNATLWSFLRRSGEVSSDVGISQLVGASGQVVLPISSSGKGRIKIELNGQPRYMVAKQFRSDANQLEVGSRVVVVEVDGGTALVSSLRELD